MTKKALSTEDSLLEDIDLYHEFNSAFRGSGALVLTSEPVVSERKLVEEAYLANKLYSPTFRYNEVAPLTHEFLLALSQKLEQSNSLPRLLLGNHIQDLIKYNDIMRLHDSTNITLYSKNKFGEVSPKLLKRAELILSETPLLLTERIDQGNTKSLDAVKLKELLQAVIKEFFPKNWGVEILNSMHARLSVSPSRSTINLRSNLMISENEFFRLVVHEIGVHTLRANNGFQQPSPLWSIGMGPDHLMSEEGLAVWVENTLGLLDSGTKVKYALRVIALSLAAHAGFAEIYRHLRNYVSPEEAYDITNRVKRGFCDTSQPGAYFKDKVYLEGFYQVEDYLTNDPTKIDILLAGKFSLSQLDLDNFPYSDIKPCSNALVRIENILHYARDLLNN